MQSYEKQDVSSSSENCKGKRRRNFSPPQVGAVNDPNPPQPGGQENGNSNGMLSSLSPGPDGVVCNYK